jgi:hypothetical protein
MSDQLLRAHQAGYVHGGIKFLPSFVKPQNCILEEGGEPIQPVTRSPKDVVDCCLVQRALFLDPVFLDRAKGKMMRELRELLPTHLDTTLRGENHEI